ncbi:hypothetical protein [Haloferula sargassicola]|uniref:Uncharacterized protein n=1 Tax=Haloferula sargassicola TaxID=490096 RepID=A0ABP9UKC1_9BACT
MNDDKPKSAPAVKAPASPPPSDPEVACTVLIAKTRIREVLKARDAKIRLPLSQANALASLNPPRVRIDGV